MRHGVKALALSALLVMPVASTAEIVGDREWLQPADVSGFSWDEISYVCDAITGACAGTLGGVDLSGWTWASTDDVGGLFRTFVPSFPFGLGEVAEINSSWAPLVFNVFRPTLATGEFEIAFGWTRTVVPTTPDTPAHAYIASVRDTFASNQYDNLLNNSRAPRNEVRSSFGGWFYRPLPTALFEQLLADVTGVGPDRKLEKIVALAQTYYQAGDQPATCAQLTYFNSQVQKLPPKKTSPAVKVDLIGQSTAIMDAIGCP